VLLQTARQTVKNIDRKKKTFQFFTLAVTITSLIVAITSLSPQSVNAQLSPAQERALNSLIKTGYTSSYPPPAAAQSSQAKGVITPCQLTESTGQGPEYKPGPPFRQGQDFAKGIPGQRLIATGKVLNLMNCKPVQGAVLDIWQGNSTGDYDYKGYNLRGKIVTDKDGNYVLNTVYPVRINTGEPGLTRPSHIHVIIGVPGQPQITTQVYFENQPKDSYLKDSLIVLPVTAANGTKIAHFNFIVEDYRGFDMNKGIAGNPTLSVISPQRALNK
jgi:protocatechuate 3,4-dioxygenase beta subunit